MQNDSVRKMWMLWVKLLNQKISKDRELELVNVS